MSRAPELGYACLGGQFQFLFPSGGLYELYWLAADSDEREIGESWDDFAARSCQEVAARFAAVLQREADFEDEAVRLEQYDPDIGALWRSRLIFCAYFVVEAEWQGLEPG